MKTVIIAAGRGSRLWGKTSRLPKTLLPFGEGTILSHILHNFGSVGMSEFVLVLGFRAALVRDYLEEHACFGFQITFIENKQWHRGNGLSVCAAQSRIEEGEKFLLSMSDHIVSPKALEKIHKESSHTNLLLVDPRLDTVYDLGDATKVHFRGNRILEIGKELENYNGVDCGIFRLTTLFFQAAEKQIALHKESITEAARILIEKEQFAPVIFPENGFWIDIDTPASYEKALAERNALME